MGPFILVIEGSIPDKKNKPEGRDPGPRLVSIRPTGGADSDLRAD